MLCMLFGLFFSRIKWPVAKCIGQWCLILTALLASESEDAIREHAKKGGFPANEIIQVSNIISPATAGLALEPATKKKL